MVKRTTVSVSREAAEIFKQLDRYQRVLIVKLLRLQLPVDYAAYTLRRDQEYVRCSVALSDKQVSALTGCFPTLSAAYEYALRGIGACLINGSLYVTPGEQDLLDRMWPDT